MFPCGFWGQVLNLRREKAAAGGLSINKEGTKPSGGQLTGEGTGFIYDAIGP